MDIKELWYGLGGQSVDPDRLELLTDDRGAMHMLNIARLNDEVHLYVVHNMMEPEIIEMIDWVGGQVDDEGHVATQVEEVEVVGDGELGTEMVEGEGDAHEIEGDGEGFSQYETLHSDHRGMLVLHHTSTHCHFCVAWLNPNTCKRKMNETSLPPPQHHSACPTRKTAGVLHQDET
ncbi:hypothetical protein LR48_Vigan02g067200 [Vigna angularis]|uniref:PB1-like domain-containing protein n=1 Tax=Phaseolus angularis TaxID=3914 RepID=A0A0L9TVV0_PHAAN|nr:hypothetical protein LR48_Vigan02g067200 [Vigna angularis]